MWPVHVVVVAEDVKDPLKVLLVQNQQPIETFRADSAHESLGDSIGLWCAKRRANDLNPLPSEHVVKWIGEFPISIPNQEAHGLRALPQVTTTAGPAGRPIVRRFGVQPATCTRRLPSS